MFDHCHSKKLEENGERRHFSFFHSRKISWASMKKKDINDSRTDKNDVSNQCEEKTLSFDEAFRVDDDRQTESGDQENRGDEQR